MFAIISDGGCDFSNKEVLKHGIQVVPFYINIDDQTSIREGIDMTKEEYFNLLINEKGLSPKTAQPSPQDYLDVMEKHLSEGTDVIILTISSKLSGSNQSATLAASMAKETYPERKIEVIDSLNASVGQGLILTELIRMRDHDLSFEQTINTVKEIIKTTSVYFTLDTLEYLKRGGRVGSTTALVGGILGLRPILHLVDGEVAQLDNVRGKKKVLSLMSEAIVTALSDEKENVNLAVGHILSETEASNFKQMVCDSLHTQFSSPLTEIGAAIGTHTGPGAMAFAYCKKYECVLGVAKKLAKAS